MTDQLASHPASVRQTNDSARHPLRGISWSLAAAGVGGGISWLTVDVLAWSRERFLVPYVLGGVTLTWLFAKNEGIDLRAVTRTHPLRTLAVILVTAALMAGTVMLQPGAPRARGLRLAFELVWDGVVYGAVDGLLLTVLPMVAMQRALGAETRTASMLGLLASLMVFVVYHLGFPEFRGTAVFAPVVAGLVFGTAYLASRNPLAPILAHALMHVAAVLHGPAGTVQLPPHY